MGAMLYATAGRRLNTHGLENLSKFRAPERVLIVCNHRTFFDFFVITAVVYWRTQLSHRILFPGAIELLLRPPHRPRDQRGDERHAHVPARLARRQRSPARDVQRVQRAAHDRRAQSSGNGDGPSPRRHAQQERRPLQAPSRARGRRPHRARVAASAHHSRVRARHGKRTPQRVRAQFPSAHRDAHRRILRAGGAPR